MPETATHATTTLGSLIDQRMISVVPGFACGDHNSQGVGTLQIRPFNITSSGSIDLSQQKHVPTTVAEDKPILTANDILFNNTNSKELVGKAALWSGPEGCAFSNHMTCIRILNSDVSPRFLASAIHAHWLIGRSEMLARAHVAQASILGERFREIAIPWPRLGEQRVLARVFDALHASLSMESELITNTQLLKRAATQTLFTRGLRGEVLKETEIGPMPEDWSPTTLSSLGRVGNGSTPKKNISDYWNGGNFPWLTSAKVYDRNIVTADQFVTQTALQECHLPIIDPGAILIAITGQGKTLGHCAVLRMRATINQHIAYVATDLEQADPSFVRGYLETQYDYFRQVGAGGGSTKGALTCAFLRTLPVPLPPTLDEQREIVEVLDAIDHKINFHERKRALLDELFEALLRGLMTGDIRAAECEPSASVSFQVAETTV